MPERRLDDKDIAGALVEPERERMAKRVRRVAPADPGLGEPVLEAPLSVAWGQRLAVTTNENRSPVSLPHPCGESFGELEPEVHLEAPTALQLPQ